MRVSLTHYVFLYDALKLILVKKENEWVFRNNFKMYAAYESAWKIVLICLNIFTR